MASRLVRESLQRADKSILAGVGMIRYLSDIMSDMSDVLAEPPSTA